MVVKGILSKGKYFDSVTLMLVARETSKLEGVLDAAVLMGTQMNKSILESSGLLLPEFRDAGDTDLLAGVKAENEDAAQKALATAHKLLKSVRKKDGSAEEFVPKSFEGALNLMPDANLALISVAGKYAADEAMKALSNGLHVMIFSDNVPLDREIELKRYAKEKGLMVMGPDCGTAIINGIPLAFANVVSRGDIGIVSASGTGLQEVASIISNEGAGISQAIGTGSRDVKRDVGGIMFIEGIRALAQDESTKVIVLISKPPHDEVLRKIAGELGGTKKLVVAVFLGADLEAVRKYGVIPAKTLEEAALFAVCLSKGKEIGQVGDFLGSTERRVEETALGELSRMSEGQKYIRGLFSGGTFCSEAQVIFRNFSSDTYSNAPLTPFSKLDDSWKSQKHTFIDLGEDEFTQGRPHPMIDFSLRNKRILEEAGDPEVAAIQLDVVLGYGSNMTPLEELSPVIREAKTLAERDGRYISIVCSIVGTGNDPQGKSKVEKGLIESGAVIVPTNASASKFSTYVANHLRSPFPSPPRGGREKGKI